MAAVGRRGPLILGIAVVLFWAGSMSWAGSFTNLQALWNFPATNSPTAYSAAGLLEASDGLLYGESYGGSTNSDFGAVFRLHKDGSQFTVLTNLLQSQGDAPSGVLIEATNGVLYGTAYDEGPSVLGSIFKVNKDGSGFAVIHDFTEGTNDGAFPSAGLLQGPDGSLYGTASYGGAGVPDQGVVFKLNLDGTGFTVLHSFTAGPSDGAYPEASLIIGTNGSLYGTTSGGGVSDAGTIFRLNTDGNGFSLVYSFGSVANDGSSPQANLLTGSNGTFYGTTFFGGAFGGASGGGVVFNLNQDGSNYQVLHQFGSVAGDGQNSFAGLAQGPDGALYGTTFAGGAASGGIVFGINPDGSNYQVLIQFKGTNGLHPQAPLLAGSDGALYGTTLNGGALNRGTVFKIVASVGDAGLLGTPLNLGGGWRISGHGVPNRTYTLQFKTNLAAPAIWAPLGSVMANSQGDWQFNDLTNSPMRFYRTSYP